MRTLCLYYTRTNTTKGNCLIFNCVHLKVKLK